MNNNLYLFVVMVFIILLILFIDVYKDRIENTSKSISVDFRGEIKCNFKIFIASLYRYAADIVNKIGTFKLLC